MSLHQGIQNGRFGSSKLERVLSRISHLISFSVAISISKTYPCTIG